MLDDASNGILVVTVCSHDMQLLLAATDLSTEMNKIHNHILFNRELCKSFMDEVAFLTVTNHTQMAELVRLSHMSRQALHELDPLIDITKLQSLLVS